ncbi:hypothetical protein GCM10007382_19630 [Salinibacterium xinjiangense]|uniref:Tubulin like n=1 Tax=Salinibacterium xinjiangense TaxID=386302 RepID=A0A2C8YT61_9MICO|nr:tubulin-like doman-containing protein [Salinibacterium xinjiangense]GGK99771.1 hypothetical protein GCM10007382_19630 [Salinibacterium xinjiangense]SOE53845.1 Tubulin like [Salinibacterium xinjiangense]
MRKFLVVGCGGSGGATLAYMMDQLRSEVAAKGVDRIPDGWQFIHIDVPVSPESEAPGLGSVRDLGGTYYGTGASGVSYAELDHRVSQLLRQTNSLGSIATWSPRTPEEVDVPISAGAGQYRSIGRMITLNKAAMVRQSLEEAWKRLFKVETDGEMADLLFKMPALGSFNPEDPPIVIVVSSMAGGAGASMAIDVCRLLTLIPGLSSTLMGVFMVSADLFDGLPQAARTGVRANSLAMLGEIVAAQSGAAREHDVALLEALGHQNGDGERVPFARVFPVGRYIGAQGTQFGDGSAQAVYRGLGRGLAAMMSSGSATKQFVAYDLGNTGALPMDRDHFGWGVTGNSLPWGSFGFASLSMGRERYREYAAQRLARTAVDRLIAGHMQKGSTASPSQQIDVLLGSQWARICADLSLPADTGKPDTGKPDTGPMLDWFLGTAYPREQVEGTARTLVESQLSSFIPSPGGVAAAQWLPVLKTKLRERRSAMAAGVSQAAHQWAYGWQQSFVEHLIAVTEGAVATFGVPFATAMLDRVEEHLSNTVIKGLEELSKRGPQDIASVPQDFEAKIGAIRGAISNGQDVVDQLSGSYRKVFRDGLAAQSAGLAGQILATSASGLTGPLKASLNEGHTLLANAKASNDQHTGIANLATEIYGAWPSDHDAKVPNRFDVANNEVLLTRSSDFPAQYQGDVMLAVQTPGDEALNFVGARATAIGQIIGGTWRTTGAARPPLGLITQSAPWRTAVFAVNPITNAVQVPTNAQFDVHVRPAEVLARARQFVGRPMESFDRFCNVSLGEFVKGIGATESEIAGRRRDISSKFRDALTLARPFVSVNTTAVLTMHGTEMAYRYKFSDIPFDKIQVVVNELTAALESTPAIDSSSFDNLREALSDTEGVTKIDIFGSYPNYSPIVFDSILEPVAKEWAMMPTMGRSDFWKWRRSRPLTAALPMGAEERRAMVGGWFIGQIVGHIRIPEAPYTTGVQIWDPETTRWVGFPNPLLTPPTSKGFANYDWLPAVLESILLAISRAHEAPVMGSLRAYRLLRELSDAGSQEPAGGLLEGSAKNTIGAWLATGVTAGGLPSRVPNIASAQTGQERLELTRVWLQGIEKLAGEQFLAAGESGATGGGAFSAITSRAQASSTPIFHDVAGDVFVEVRKILGMLEEALAVGSGVGPLPVAAQSPPERPEDFTLPEGGVF